MADLEELEEGMVIDTIIESENDKEADSYQELANQADFDAF